MASTSKHVFEFIGKSDSLSRSSKDAATSLGKVEAATSKVGSIAKFALAGVGVAAIGAFVKSSVGAALEAEKAQNRLEAVFKATGETTGEAAQEAADYAGELSQLIGVDDELIMAGQAILVTFKDVSSEAARAAGVFDDATAAGADLAAAGFGSIEANAKLLGIALNDPIAGLGRLRKAGVQFTEQQQAQIRTMVETGDLLGAQKVILAEIETQVGGTAEATASSVDKMAVKWDEFQEKFGGAILPLLEQGVGLFDAAIGPLEDFAAGIGEIVEALSGMQGGLAQAAAAVPLLAGALVLLYANPVIAGIGLVVAAVVKIGEAARNERENVEALTEDILALGEASQVAVSGLINPQAQAAADALGVSIGTLTGLVNGSVTEIDAWEASQLEANAANGEASEFVRILARHVRNLQEDTVGARDAAKAYREEQKRLANAALESGSALDHERDALYDAADAQGEAEGATQGHTDALQRQMEKLRAATDPVFAFTDAKRGQRDAERDATAALEEFGASSPEYREALDDLAQSTIGAKEAALGLAGVDLEQYRDELVRSGIQSGLTRAAAEQMANDVVAGLQRIIDKGNELDGSAYNFTVTQHSNVVGGGSFMAKGGPVKKGDVAVVGEEGPEIVKFGASGVVIPNDKIPTITGTSPGGGGAGFVQVININLHGTFVAGNTSFEDAVVSSIKQAQDRGRIPRADAVDVRPVKRQRRTPAA